MSDFPLPCLSRIPVRKSVRLSISLVNPLAVPFRPRFRSTAFPIAGDGTEDGGGDGVRQRQLQMTLSTKDGQREDGRTELGGQFLHSLAAESFSSLLPAPLPRSHQDVFCSSMSSAR